MGFLRHFIATGCLCSACLMSLSAIADDDYLKMLEGEAENLTLDQSGQLDNKSAYASSNKDKKNINRKWGSYSLGENLPLDLKQDEFEGFLESSFMGTYVFYRKLNSNDRNTVYLRYSKGEAADIENVRKNVLSLLKQ